VITIVIKSKIKSNEIYKKETVQHVNATVEDAGNFFPVLVTQKITPETMGFQITDFDSKPMYAGQIIQYKVTPLLGITISWMTEISFVKENSYFVDEQRFGPYALWHHKHFFEATENGTKMTDVVHYALPLGF
jgi:ligand-binding SRPBCC domain-containing protein